MTLVTTFSVSIGDFVSDIDTDGLRVTTDVSGWTDGPEIASAISSRPQQDGAFDATGYTGARVIGVEGVVKAPSHDAAVAVADTLTALRGRTPYEFAVTDSVGTRFAMVRVTVGAVITWLRPETFRYVLQVKAPDPLKYGAPSFMATDLAAASPGTGWVWPAVFPVDWGVPPGSTPGAISLANAGTVAYWPRLRLRGPVTNPVVSLLETGAWIRYGGTIPGGQWIDVDLAGRKVLLNGEVSKRQFVTSSGDWLAVPPGGGSVSWVADSADPAALLSVWGYEGAWI